MKLKNEIKDRFEVFMIIISNWAILFAGIISISFGVFETKDGLILFGMFILLVYSYLTNIDINKYR